MIEAISVAASRFRKKYALALMLFTAGTTMAFMHHWSASEYTIFASLLLSIFGGADLIDKKMPNAQVSL